MEAEFPDWFSAYAKPNFEKFLPSYITDDRLTFLQLGAYTGDASVWLAENILTKPGQVLFDVDTWAGSDEEAHKSINFNEVYKTYKDKTKDYKQIISVHSPSFNYLLNYNYFKYYEFIYVDADHTAASVLLDAELSWRLLRQGGLLAFDDYQWGAHLPASKSPKLGIDLFLERHAGEYEILEQSLQVWLRKL